MLIFGQKNPLTISRTGHNRQFNSQKLNSYFLISKMDLPHEIILHCMQFVDVKSAVMFASTCHDFRWILNEKNLSSTLVRRFYGVVGASANKILNAARDTEFDNCLHGYYLTLHISEYRSKSAENQQRIRALRKLVIYPQLFTEIVDSIISHLSAADRIQFVNHFAGRNLDPSNGRMTMSIIEKIYDANSECPKVPREILRDVLWNVLRESNDVFIKNCLLRDCRNDWLRADIRKYLSDSRISMWS